MAIRGTFKEFSVSDIIQLIHYQKKSGRLTVHHKGTVWTLGFEKGSIVLASSDEKGMPRLGEILVRQGYLDRESLAEALRQQEDRPRPLGKVLEEMNAVSHETIARALHFQIQETALNLFFHQEGEYMFERVPVSYDTNYITPINTEFVLMEGARRVDEWPAIRRIVKGANSVFSQSDSAGAKKDGLPESQQTVLMAVDGQTSVADMVLNLNMGLFETCNTLAGLMSEACIILATPGTSDFKDPVTGDVWKSDANVTPVAAGSPSGAPAAAPAGDTVPDAGEAPAGNAGPNW